MWQSLNLLGVSLAVAVEIIEDGGDAAPPAANGDVKPEANGGPAAGEGPDAAAGRGDSAALRGFPCDSDECPVCQVDLNEAAQLAKVRRAALGPGSRAIGDFGSWALGFLLPATVPLQQVQGRAVCTTQRPWPNLMRVRLSSHHILPRRGCVGGERMRRRCWVTWCPRRR